MTQLNYNDPRQFIDKQLVARCFAHSRNTYEQEASVQREVAEKMMNLLTERMATDSCTHKPQRVVEIGCGTGSFSRLLYAQLHPESLLLNDLCPEMEECLADLCQRPGVFFRAEDAEFLNFPAETELIASCSTLQWFNQPKTFFERCYQALSHDGWLAFSTFGKQNMFQIKELTGHGLSYLTIDEWKQLLEPLFEIKHAEESLAVLEFDSPLEVLKHMKQTGVTGTEKRMWTRGILQKFCQDYTYLFKNENGKVTLTYHPIYILAKKKNL